MQGLAIGTSMETKSLDKSPALYAGEDGQGTVTGSQRQGHTCLTLTCLGEQTLLHGTLRAVQALGAATAAFRARTRQIRSAMVGSRDPAGSLRLKDPTTSQRGDSNAGYISLESLAVRSNVRNHLVYEIFLQQNLPACQ